MGAGASMAVAQKEMEKPTDCSDLDGCDTAAAIDELVRIRALLHKYSTCDKALDASDVAGRAEAIQEITVIRSALRLQTAQDSRIRRPGSIYLDPVGGGEGGGAGGGGGGASRVHSVELYDDDDDDDSEDDDDDGRRASEAKGK